MIIIAKTEMKITVVTEITKGLIGIEEAGVGTGRGVAPETGQQHSYAL